jgi:hypothetical protein
MNKPHTPAGTDDIPAGTTGPTPTGDGRPHDDHTSPPSTIEGGEENKPA